jgi:hypothetical protein
MDHVAAKTMVESLGAKLSPLESLFLRGVSWHETNYGAGWKGDGQGSNNMGAVTTNDPDELSFRYQDSRNDEGELVRYTAWFKGYATPEEGFADLARVLLKSNVRAALAARDVRGAVAAMQANRYFLGTHRRDTPEGLKANLDAYYGAVRNALKQITAATGEKLDALTRRGGDELVALVGLAALVWWSRSKGWI